MGLKLIYLVVTRIFSWLWLAGRDSAAKDVEGEADLLSAPDRVLLRAGQDSYRLGPVGVGWQWPMSVRRHRR